MTDALTRAGELAIEEAERLWAMDVYDPKWIDKSPPASASRRVIEEVIQRAGWGWTLPYRGPEPQWCGLYAAACWIKAGLDPKWTATYWASTYRLTTWARYIRFSAKHPNPKPLNDDRRLIVKLEPGEPLAFESRPGDVVIVGDGEPDAGDHVTLCVAYSDVLRSFETLSGNGGGVGPKGNRREGISRRTYSIDSGSYRAMWVIRPAFGDLLAEKP